MVSAVSFSDLSFFPISFPKPPAVASRKASLAAKLSFTLCGTSPNTLELSPESELQTFENVLETKHHRTHKVDETWPLATLLATAYYMNIHVKREHTTNRAKIWKGYWPWCHTPFNCAPTILASHPRHICIPCPTPFANGRQRRRQRNALIADLNNVCTTVEHAPVRSSTDCFDMYLRTTLVRDCTLDLIPWLVSLDGGVTIDVASLVGFSLILVSIGDLSRVDEGPGGNSV